MNRFHPAEFEFKLAGTSSNNNNYNSSIPNFESSAGIAISTSLATNSKNRNLFATSFPNRQNIGHTRAQFLVNKNPPAANQNNINSGLLSPSTFNWMQDSGNSTTMSVSLDNNIFLHPHQRNLRDSPNFAAPHHINLRSRNNFQMNAGHHSGNTNSSSLPLATPPTSSAVADGQSLGNAGISSQKTIISHHTSPSDLFDINQNFTLAVGDFNNKSAVLDDFDISNPDLFLNDDFPLSPNTELSNFDFDWPTLENDFLTNSLSFFDASNESRLNTLSDVNTPFIENPNRSVNDVNSFVTEFQETNPISNSSALKPSRNTNDLDVLDPSTGKSYGNNKRSYTNIIDEQSSLSVSIVNKRPKTIQQKNELNINRRKSIPAVDTIVNSFNRPFMSQTDTITHDTSVNTATAIISMEAEDNTTTTSASNAILCVNRHEFFCQMNTRLSTLAQFIKQSFRRQSDYADLWERLYPLLKFECQQIQRLIDLTDFKSLNFPKNLGQYSEYDIEKDAMNFIPEHVTDYRFPLKVQQDGNEGFRAVSALLNCNHDNLINRGINNKEQLHEELRVRVVLEMVNRIDKNRRIFEKHTEEISANGGNITTTSVYEGYFQKDTIELLSHFELSTNAPQYALLIWQIESLNTCVNGALIGIPQLCILANTLKATIRIIYPDKENRYFNAPIKCRGNSKRMLYFLMYNPLYRLQFPKPPIERYYITPLVRKSDIFFNVLAGKPLTQLTQLQSQQFEQLASGNKCLSSAVTAKILGKQRAD